MKTFRLDALPDTAMGRRCELTNPRTGHVWRGTLAALFPKPRTFPGHYVVAVRASGGLLLHTPPLPGDTEIHIYPKETP